MASDGLLQNSGLTAAAAETRGLPRRDAPMYSPLASDPDLEPLVAMFVAELPQRVAQLRSCLRQGDWGPLARVAHQLKGAAGSYGFAALTPLLAELDDAIRRAADRGQVRAALAAVIRGCRRVRAGRPG